MHEHLFAKMRGLSAPFGDLLGGADPDQAVVIEPCVRPRLLLVARVVHHDVESHF
jgi:hypothetical protein